MKKLTFFALAALVAAPAAADPREASPNDPTCRVGGKPAVLVRVTGLKNGAGKVRVQAYGARDFLKKGAWAGRVDVPLAGRRALDICLPLPIAGSYALAVRHDANANKKSDWNDGAGFSRNPRLGLTSKPSFTETAIKVGNAPARVSVVMNYRQGLKVGPRS
ncbi:DUF2141 domain-containing protein [Sphingomonas mesophila]|uniref:DUF2141 domain-containing protein n=1 Tax=Sphingomonas mesophila TaxID=2303576 RepID=UPI000E5962B4|nr:DUF2141 domain-containing protein [Sphingomonas mesophila]